MVPSARLSEDEHHVSGSLSPSKYSMLCPLLLSWGQPVIGMACWAAVHADPVPQYMVVLARN